MIFTAAAVWVAGAVGVTSALGIAAINVGVRVLAGAVISKLVTKRQDAPSGGGASPTQQPTGSRIQLRPSTDNKIGVVYGDAFVSGALIDAKISEDQKQMWYVYAIAEVTDSGVISIGDLTSTTETFVYWGDKTCIFDTTDRSKVVKFINSDGEDDPSVNGYLNMYFFRSGSYTPINGAQSAIDILSDPAIAADQRWNSSRYTYSGHAPTMAHTMFVIVKLTYNQDASIVGEEQLQVRLQNSLTKPGDVIYDYLSNARYGGAIPYDQIDRASFDALNAYSDELITYTPVGGGTATQPRYRINGPVNTSDNVMTNIEYLVDSCDSWLQWNESLAKWSVVINQSYLDYTTYDDLFVIDASNITSGIGITPIDLNGSYNIIETQFPNSKIKDQTDYQFVYLDEADQNPNEPINKLILRYPQVNNSVQAKYLATRRLIQAREDLYITFDMDYSGIQIDAGDVVRINFPAYGWGPIPSNPSNPDKLFRVDQVQELKDSEGNLGVRVSMFEYNNQVFENIDISDYQPAANTGITDPTIVGKPNPPTIENINQESGTFDVTMTIPVKGAIIAVEFWYGPTPTIEGNNYKLWDTQFNSGTPVYTAGTTESSGVVGFQPGDYYWAVRCLTQTTKSEFSNSTSQSWSPSQIPTTKTCSQITTQPITYSDLYKLWAPNTRGTAMVCDYIPTGTGIDINGVSIKSVSITGNYGDKTPGTYPATIGAPLSGGTQAEGTVTVNSDGASATFLLTNPGTGYVSAPTVTCAAANLGGSGTMIFVAELSNSSIKLDFNQTVYSATSSTGLVSELWQAVNSWNMPITSIGYGSNGFVFTAKTTPDNVDGSPADKYAIYFTGNIQGDDSPNPDTYVDYKIESDYFLNDSCGNSSGVYVVVGDSGELYTSSTGYGDWTQPTLPANAVGRRLMKVIWTGSLFVVVGGNTGVSLIITSPDGVTWTERYFSSTAMIWSVYNVGSRVMALGSDFWQFDSTNGGVSWSSVQVGGGSGYNFYDITYAIPQNIWIAVGEGDGTSVIVASNDDGASWNLQYAGAAGAAFFAVATNFDVYTDTYAVGTDGEFAFSGDGGLTWQQAGPPTTVTWNTIRKFNGSFYAMSNEPWVYGNLVAFLTTDAPAFKFINFWQTTRLWSYGSNPTDPYSTVIQPTPDQLQNNASIGASLTSGAYFAGVTTRYMLIAGDLNNPSTPSTVYSSRKTITITEYKG